MKTILIATTNRGKYAEILEILGPLPYEFLSLADLRLSGDFAEDGATFAENALGKARYYQHQSGLPTIAEDSGIVIDALKGELGVKTRRWGKGENASDKEWIEYFLEVMADVPDAKRSAAFVCAAVYITEDGREHLFEGKTEGHITRTLEAPIYGGLPLSSCFKPIGFERVYSALPVEEKNRISHRGKAIHPIYDLLSQS